jgi:hypothetical protein
MDIKPELIALQLVEAIQTIAKSQAIMAECSRIQTENSCAMLENQRQMAASSKQLEKSLMAATNK